MSSELGHYSLIAGTSGDTRRKLTAFSCSYSATGGTRTRTRMAAPIEYEYEFDAINTGDQRAVSELQPFAKEWVQQWKQAAPDTGIFISNQS